MLVVMARFLSLGAQPNPGGSVRSRRDRKGIGVSAVQFFFIQNVELFRKIQSVDISFSMREQTDRVELCKIHYSSKLLGIFRSFIRERILRSCSIGTADCA